MFDGRTERQPGRILGLVETSFRSVIAIRQLVQLTPQAPPVIPTIGAIDPTISFSAFPQLPRLFLHISRCFFASIPPVSIQASPCEGLFDGRTRCEGEGAVAQASLLSQVAIRPSHEATGSV